MIDVDSRRLETPVFEVAFWILVAVSCVAIVFGWWIGWIALSFLLYGGFVEPRLVTVKTFRLPLVAEPKIWLRVAFLSDLHAGLYKDAAYYARVVRRVMAEKPDVILIGGDLVEDAAKPAEDLAPLAELQAPLGKFFILGNHDFIDDPRHIASLMRAWGYDDVTNAVRRLEKDGRSLTMIALEDAYRGHPEVALLRREHPKPRLLLLHEPDNLLDVEAGDGEAIVMGHTHGGQVRLPIIGKFRKLPQIVSQSYDRGLKDWRGIPVVISQGIGESSSRARLFCPPEIVILELGI